MVSFRASHMKTCATICPQFMLNKIFDIDSKILSFQFGKQNQLNQTGLLYLFNLYTKLECLVTLNILQVKNNVYYLQVHVGSTEALDLFK